MFNRRQSLLLVVAVVGASAWAVAACTGPEPILPSFDASTPDVSTCVAPMTVCGTTCTSLSDDPANCGMCGKACGTGSTCVSGVCTSAETLCTPDAGAPYFANLQTDNANCGACGNACASPNWCLDGQCYAKSCADLLSKVGGEFPDAGASDAASDAAVLLPDGGVFPDGTYTIDPDGTGPIKPFPVYCYGMNTASPREYLTLAHSLLSGEPSSNYVTLGGGGACPCGAATFEYTRVHLNVTTLTIDVNDHTFAIQSPSVGACWLAQSGACLNTFKNVQYGVAWDCACGARGGLSNVDLRGTGFSIASSVSYMLNGFQPGGSATIDDAGATATGLGGGCCGGEYPQVTTDAGIVTEIVLKQN